MDSDKFDNVSSLTKNTVLWMVLCNPVALAISVSSLTQIYSDGIKLNTCFLFLFFTGMCASIFYYTAMHLMEVYALEGKLNHSKISHKISLFCGNITLAGFFIGSYFALCELHTIFSS